MADITLSLQGLVNLSEGTKQLAPTTLTKTLTVFEEQNKYLALGNNAIVLPRNSVPAVVTTYCLILFDQGNYPCTYTLKGINGDTGVSFPSGSAFALIPANADFVINSSTLNTLATKFIFF